MIIIVSDGLALPPRWRRPQTFSPGRPDFFFLPARLTGRQTEYHPGTGGKRRPQSTTQGNERKILP